MAAPAVYETFAPAPMMAAPAVYETFAPAPMMSAPMMGASMPMTTMAAPLVGSISAQLPMTTMAAPMTTMAAPIATLGAPAVGTSYGLPPTIFREVSAGRDFSGTSIVSLSVLPNFLQAMRPRVIT